MTQFIRQRVRESSTYSIYRMRISGYFALLLRGLGAEIVIDAPHAACHNPRSGPALKTLTTVPMRLRRSAKVLTLSKAIPLIRYS
jgi:hypothetical protein